MFADTGRWGFFAVTTSKATAGSRVSPPRERGEFLGDDRRLRYGHRDDFHRIGVRRGALRVTSDDWFRCDRVLFHF